jgi:hypothetical protein
MRKHHNLLPLDGGGFTLLNFAVGEPCEAGIQQGKGGGDEIISILTFYCFPLPVIPSRQGRGKEFFG